MTKLTLVVHEPGQAARRVPAEAGLTLGRHPQCGLVLSDAAVSARHARLVDRDGALLIEDLGGTNPVRCAGRTLKKGEAVALQHGASLVVGQTRIEVEGEALPDTTRVASEPGATVVAGPSDTVAAAPPTAHRPPPAEETVVAAEKPAPAAPPPAAAAPRETIQAEPVPATTRAQLPDPPSSSGGDGTIATLVYDKGFDPSDPHQVLALRAALAAARPRLVFANEADRRIFDLAEATVVLGRSKQAGCRLNHPGVSGEHARVSFDPARRRFFVEDLGGANKTLVDDEMLAPGMPRELRAGAHLQLGPVEALFVVDKDPQGHALPAERYAAAADVLEREGAIQPSQRARAEADAAAGGRHVGELLLVQEAVTIRQWLAASKQAEVLLLTRKKKPVRKNPFEDPRVRWAAIGGGAALLIVILVLLLS